MISAGQTTTPATGPTTLDLITPLVCPDNLAEEERNQCVQTVTDSYTQSRERVPENLRVVFDGVVGLIINLIFKYCSTMPAESQSAVRCMQDAVSGENPLISIWGQIFSIPNFFAELANKLSGQIFSFQVGNPTRTDQETEQPSEADYNVNSYTDSGRSQEGCILPNSAQGAVLQTLPNDEARIRYMQEHHLCY